MRAQAILEYEGVVLADTSDLHSKAWLQLAVEEGKARPLQWALRRAEGMKDEQVRSSPRWCAYVVSVGVFPLLGRAPVLQHDCAAALEPDFHVSIPLSVVTTLHPQVVQEVFCWSRNPAEVRHLAARKEELYRALLGEHSPPVAPGVKLLLETLTKHQVRALELNHSPEFRVGACEEVRFVSLSV